MIKWLDLLYDQVFITQFDPSLISYLQLIKIWYSNDCGMMVR